MDRKRTIKICVDFLMTMTMFILMCYPYTGGDNHEIAGAVLLILFILHQIENRNWYKSLKKGRYTFPRILQTVVDISLLVVMLLQMISGISMSRYIFTFVPFGLSAAISRIIHMVCAYAGFLLMSFHVGLHGGRMMNMTKKFSRLKAENKYQASGLRMIVGGIFVYGIYALVKRDFIDYITMQMHFAFFDYGEPVLFFVIDYSCIMGTMVFLAYYLQKGLVKQKNSSLEKERIK